MKILSRKEIKKIIQEEYESFLNEQPEPPSEAKVILVKKMKNGNMEVELDKGKSEGVSRGKAGHLAKFPGSRFEVYTLFPGVRSKARTNVPYTDENKKLAMNSKAVFASSEAPAGAPEPEKKPKKKKRRRKMRRCGERGSEYGQQGFEALLKRPLKSKVDPEKKERAIAEYDRFYDDLKKHELLDLLDLRPRKGRKYGKDYWWGSRHQYAYMKLLCVVEAAGEPLSPAEPEKKKPYVPDPEVQADYRRGVGAHKIDWCAERSWRTAPKRLRSAAFLEKNEKEGLVYYDKWPNSRPAGWDETIRLNMRNRVRALMDWTRRYMSYVSRGKLALSINILEKMILNSGSVDKEGIKGMRANVRKMIDCELRHARGEIGGPSIEVPAPAQQIPVPTPSPEPRPEPVESPNFQKAIGSLRAGDKFSLKMRKTVKHKINRALPAVTVFKAGETYYGFVKGNNIVVETNWGQQSKTKDEFVDLVEKKSGGDPCNMVYCDDSTVTRGSKKKTFIDYLRNPNFAMA